MRKTKQLVSRLKANTDGAIGPTFALMAMPMFFVIGMSIDYSRTVGVENSVQNALDAGALAAMINSDQDPEVIGSSYFYANLHNTNVMNPIVHFTKMEDGTVRATASVSVPTTVANLMGVNTFQVETFSVVEPSHTETNTETTTVADSNVVPCLHVMDQSGSYTMDLNNNKDVDARYCTVRIRSNSSSAFRSQNSNNVKFKKIRIKGGGNADGGMTVDNGAGIDEQEQIVANPYDASIRDVVQAISIGSCTNSNTGTTTSPKVWTGTVSPGTFCGTTEFKNATFGTGLYIIKSGNGNGKDGALKFSGSIDGSAGVTFMLADNKTKLTSYSVNDNSVLKAPTSGTTRGILFFEDSNRGQNWSLSITDTKNSWQGLVYLPSANLTLTLTDWSLFNVSISANQFKMTSWDDINWMAYSWTPFNTTDPITLDDETTTTTTTTTSATDIYLKE